MYKKVIVPKRVTQKWLDHAFAPLRNYLNKHYTEDAEKIIVYLMFMGNEDERFYYKNRITRAYIVFDQAGELVSCSESALQYQFDWFFDNKGVPPQEERFIHPNVSKWVRKSLNKKDADTYGEDVSIFLQDLWGPIVNYDFSDLAVGYPPRDLRLPHSLYIYPKACRAMMAFQFIGDAIAEGRCSPQEQRDHAIREQRLTFNGWRVMSFIRETLEMDLSFVRERLAQLLAAGE